MKRSALICIFITVTVDVMGLGIIGPVMPSLLMELTNEGVSAAAQYGGWLLGLFALVQFITLPVLGGLSDRFGRRPILLISLMAYGINFVGMGLASSLLTLFVLRAFTGIFSATISTANAYVADASPPEKRTANFGLLGAAFGLGFVLGPALGGLLGGYGTRLPFFAAGALCLANAVFGYFALPESLVKDHRRPFSVRRSNPIGAFFQLRRYPTVSGLVVAVVTGQLATMAMFSTWAYYTTLKFHWSPREVGMSLALIGFMFVVIQGGVAARVSKAVGEQNAVLLGLTISAVTYFGMAIAGSTPVVLAWLVLSCFGAVAGPALTSIMIRQVPPNAQGELQGSLASLNSLVAIMAPILMTTIFYYFSSTTAHIVFPGAAFLLAAILLAAAAVVTVRTFALQAENARNAAPVPPT